MDDAKYMDGVLINTFSSLKYDLNKFNENYAFYQIKEWDKLPYRGNFCPNPIIEKKENNLYTVKYFAFIKTQSGDIKILAQITDKYKLEICNGIQILKLVKKYPKILTKNNVSRKNG